MILMNDNKISVYKEKVNHKNYLKWAKYVSALANLEGGLIYFGILKDKTVIGLSKVDKDINFIKNILDNKIKPNLNYEINKIELDNKLIIELEILENKNKPIFIKDINNNLLSFNLIKNKVKPIEYDTLVNYFNSEIINDKYSAKILEFCQTPKSRKEIQEHIGISSRPYFRINILAPLLRQNLLEPTNKNPRASNQKYITKTNN